MGLEELVNAEDQRLQQIEEQRERERAAAELAVREPVRKLAADAVSLLNARGYRPFALVTEAGPEHIFKTPPIGRVWLVGEIDRIFSSEMGGFFGFTDTFEPTEMSIPKLRHILTPNRLPGSFPDHIRLAERERSDAFDAEFAAYCQHYNVWGVCKQNSYLETDYVQKYFVMEGGRLMLRVASRREPADEVIAHHIARLSPDSFLPDNVVRIE